MSDEQEQKIQEAVALGIEEAEARTLAKFGLLGRAVQSQQTAAKRIDHKTIFFREHTEVVVAAWELQSRLADYNRQHNTRLRFDPKAESPQAAIKLQRGGRPRRQE